MPDLFELGAQRKKQRQEEVSKDLALRVQLVIVLKVMKMGRPMTAYPPEELYLPGNAYCQSTLVSTQRVGDGRVP